MPERAGAGPPTDEIAPTEPAASGGHLATMSTERGDLPVDDAAGADAFTDAWPESDRYALIGEIARGGGGRIAIAMDRKLGRRIALKRPLDRGGGRRLEREALVMARLEHPSIVPIHDAGREPDGTPFYAMKLLGGPNLSERIRGATTFEARLGLLRVVGAVADAMAYAHARGVIHRDLKPANVVVGEFGEVAVIDWGLAKVTDAGTGDVGVALDDETTPGSETISAQLTQAGDVMGTPAYMPPEQAAGDEVGAAADVYALGAMLYHVLAGELPYGRVGGDAQVAKLRAGPPPPVDEREPRVPAELAAIVGKAMARDPAARYPTARELADDLHRYETGRLVAAHRYSPALRARRWLGRHRFAVAAAVATIGVGATGVLYATRAPVVETCVGLDAPVVAVWGPPQRAALARAFAASGLPYAAAQTKLVVDTLDDRAHRIVLWRQDVCRAREIGEQSSEVADLRMTCLDRHTGQLRAVVDTLAHADRELVPRATELFAMLGRADDCADVARLRDAVPLPDDARRRAEILAVEDAIVGVKTRRVAGDEVGAEAVMPAVLGRALATGYAPAIARASTVFGETLSDRGRPQEAAAVLRQAVLAAERGKVPRARAAALQQLAYLSYEAFDKLDDADAYAQASLAIADALDDDEARASAINALSAIASRRGDHDLAIALARRAIALDHGLTAVQQGEAIGQLGSQLAHARRFDEAVTVLEQALALFRKAYGTDDVQDIGIVFQNLGTIAYQRHDLATAEEMFRKAGHAFERTISPDAPVALAVEMDQAVVMTAREHFAEAQALLEALLPRARKTVGPGASLVQDLLYNLGDALRFQGKLDQALVRYRETLALRLAAEPRAGDAARARAAIGSTLLEAGRVEEALPEIELALAQLQRLEGGDSYDAAYARAELGKARLARGEAMPASAALSRALHELDAEGDEHDRGDARFALAQARWMLGDRIAARKLAAEARALFVTATGHTAELAKIDAWIAAHP